jgi:hypothetical protein
MKAAISGLKISAAAKPIPTRSTRIVPAKFCQMMRQVRRVMPRSTTSALSHATHGVSLAATVSAMN